MVIVNNLGLAHLALKMHVFSTCVIGVSQLSFNDLPSCQHKFPNQFLSTLMDYPLVDLNVRHNFCQPYVYAAIRPK
jgi:hypothetical protein